MKLHLPTSLRRSLLACFSTVQALFPTLAAGHIGGGLLAFAVSLAAVPSVQAAETSYTDAELKSLTLGADDIVTFSGTNTISGTLSMTATPITVKLTGGASLTLGSVNQGANSNNESFTHTFQTDGAARGQLTVGDFGGKDCMTINFSHIDVNITNTARIGSGSSYTLDDSSYTYGSEGSPLGEFKIWSWDERIGSSLNLVHGSAATFFSDLVMCEMTAINMTGSSTTVNGNLIIQDGYFNDTVSERVVTLRGETPAGEGAVASSMSVTGNVRIGAGYTLKVLGSLPLTVAGTYNSGASGNTVLEVGPRASATFGSFKTGAATTIQGDGHVTVTGNLDMAENASLTLSGSETTVTVNGTLNMGFDKLSVHLAEGTTLAAGRLSQQKPSGDPDDPLGGFTHKFTGGGTLDVEDFPGKDRMNVSFDATKLVFGKSGTHDGKIGSGSTYAFTNGAGLTFGAHDAANYKERTFTIWSWLRNATDPADDSWASTISFANSAAVFYSNLEMKTKTKLHLEGYGSYMVYGDLKLSSSGGDRIAPRDNTTDQKIVTLSAASVGELSPWGLVGGDLVFEDGFTLKLEGMPLTVSGAYNSTGVDHTTLDVDAGSSISFGSMKIGTAGTIQGSGHASVLGNLSIKEGGTLTVASPSPMAKGAYNLKVVGSYNAEGTNNTTLDVRTGSTANIGFLNLANGTTLTGGGLVEASSADVPDNANVIVTNGTTLEITEGKEADGGQKRFDLGSGSSLTLSDGSSLLFGSRKTVDANKYLILWSS